MIFVHEGKHYHATYDVDRSAWRVRLEVHRHGATPLCNQLMITSELIRRHGYTTFIEIPEFQAYHRTGSVRPTLETVLEFTSSVRPNARITFRVPEGRSNTFTQFVNQYRNDGVWRVWAT